MFLAEREATASDLASKDGTVSNKLQAHRNAYAKRVAEEEKKRKEEAERQAKLQQERIDVKSKLIFN